MPVSYVYRYGAVDISGKVMSCTGISVTSISPLMVAEVAVKVSDALADADKLVLDEFMASRGFMYCRQVSDALVFHATSKVVDIDKEVVSQDWVTLGGVVTNPSFFSCELSALFCRIVGSFRADGAGSEYRILEINAAGEEVELCLAQIPDTGGAWQMMRFDSIAPRMGSMTYLFQGRLGAAASSASRFVTFTMLERK